MESIETIRSAEFYYFFFFLSALALAWVSFIFIIFLHACVSLMNINIIWWFILRLFVSHRRTIRLCIVMIYIFSLFPCRNKSNKSISKSNAYKTSNYFKNVFIDFVLPKKKKKTNEKNWLMNYVICHSWQPMNKWIFILLDQNTFQQKIVYKKWKIIENFLLT